MNETNLDVEASVYEISYLIAGVPEERVGSEAEQVKSLIVKAGGVIIADEAPRRERLAYTMRKKTVSGAYDKYDEAYFGWVKLELGSDKIEVVKKEVEVLPSILRMLLISTVRENTYLGRHSSGTDASLTKRPSLSALTADVAAAPVKKDEIAPAASVEDMDKSIDEMVKEV